MNAEGGKSPGLEICRYNVEVCMLRMRRVFVDFGENVNPVLRLREDAYLVHTLFLV